jgi:hypothetical protein
VEPGDPPIGDPPGRQGAPLALASRAEELGAVGEPAEEEELRSAAPREAGHGQRVLDAAGVLEAAEGDLEAKVLGRGEAQRMAHGTSCGIGPALEIVLAPPHHANNTTARPTRPLRPLPRWAGNTLELRRGASTGGLHHERIGAVRLFIADSREHREALDRICGDRAVAAVTARLLPAPDAPEVQVEVLGSIVALLAPEDARLYRKSLGSEPTTVRAEILRKDNAIGIRGETGVDDRGTPPAQLPTGGLLPGRPHYRLLIWAMSLWAAWYLILGLIHIVPAACVRLTTNQSGIDLAETRFEIFTGEVMVGAALCVAGIAAAVALLLRISQEKAR